MKMSLVLNHENLLNFRNVKHTKGCPDTACIEVGCVITFDIYPFKINSRDVIPKLPKDGQEDDVIPPPPPPCKVLHFSVFIEEIFKRRPCLYIFLSPRASPPS